MSVLVPKHRSHPMGPSHIMFKSSQFTRDTALQTDADADGADADLSQPLCSNNYFAALPARTFNPLLQLHCSANIHTPCLMGS